MPTQYPTLDCCIVTTDQLCLGVSLKPNSFHKPTSYHINANNLHAEVKCILAFSVSMQQCPVMWIANCRLAEARALPGLLFPWCSYLRDSGLDKRVILKDVRFPRTYESRHTLSLLTPKIIINLMFSIARNVTCYVVMFSQTITSCGFQRISVAFNLLC